MSDERKITGYDPMTGQPIYEQADSRPDLFDPYTGKPLMQGGAENQFNAGNSFSGDMIGGSSYYRSTENTTSGKAGGSKKGIAMPSLPSVSNNAVAVIGVVVISVLVIALLIGAVYFNRKPVKILRAAVKTANDAGYLVDDLKKGFFISDAFTFSVGGEVMMEGEGVSGDVSLAIDGKDKQISGNVKIPYLGNYEAIAEINSKDVRAAVPTIDDTVFVYNYRDEKNGVIEDVISEAGMEMEMIDSAIEQVYELKMNDLSVEKDIAKICKKFYMNLDFEKIDSKEIEVNGKDRKCAGYEITITGEDILELYDNLFEFYSDYMEKNGEEISDSFGSALGLRTNEDYYRELRDEMEDDLSYMDDIEIDVYLYKGMLAGIDVPQGDGQLSIQFNGGDYRLQNATMKYEMGSESYAVLEMKGERDGKEDEIAICVEGEELAKIKYDAKSGDYDLALNDGYDEYKLSGNLSTSKKGYVVSVNLSDIDYIDADVTLSLLKGAKMKKIEGEEFDVGNAGISDFMSLVDWMSAIEMIDDFM